MANLSPEQIEEEIINVVEEICTELKINVTVDREFCPGDYIKSQVLLDTISVIEEALGITIPNECYIFREKDNRELTIAESVAKIIKVTKNGN